MITAEIIADSISPSGSRITSFVLEYPRFFHVDLLTHRVLSRNGSSCLSGDTLIYIEKPSKVKNGEKSIHMKIPIRDLVNRWFRKGRNNLKTRIKRMYLRCLNEDTGEFTTTNIQDCFIQGINDIYEIELENGNKIKCTKNHKIFTENGWQTLESMGLTHTISGIVTWNNNHPKIATNGFVLTKEFLETERDSGKTIKKIAEENNLKYKSVAGFCERNKIKFRKEKSFHNTDFSYKNKDWLQNKINEGLFATQIAELCNTSYDKIKKQMKKFGIKGNKWVWGCKEVWNKGKTYKQKEESLIKVREVAKNRIKKDKYKNYEDEKVRRTVFLREIRLEIMNKFNFKCVISKTNKHLELHHIEPCWFNKSKIYDKDNLIPLNKKVHSFIHDNNLDLVFMNYYLSGQDPSKFIDLHNDLKLTCEEIGKPKAPGNTLVTRFYHIKNIKYVGKEETYDIEVSGEYKNFVANGIVVHNSRAMPSITTIKRVLDNMEMPYYWGKNQPGMKARSELSNTRKKLAKVVWKTSGYFQCFFCYLLNKIGLHKQHANRIIEPYVTMRIVCTATDWKNFFYLRNHPDAQPEFEMLAALMQMRMNESTPRKLNVGEWHIPFGDKIDEKRLSDLVIPDEFDCSSETMCKILTESKIKVAVARCARVSYYNFEGKDDYNSDFRLYRDLVEANPKHLSPTEHVAQCLEDNRRVGNFKGWKQYRKFILGENPDE